MLLGETILTETTLVSGSLVAAVVGFTLFIAGMRSKIAENARTMALQKEDITGLRGDSKESATENARYRQSVDTRIDQLEKWRIKVDTERRTERRLENPTRPRGSDSGDSS